MLLNVSICKKNRRTFFLYKANNCIINTDGDIKVISVAISLNIGFSQWVSEERIIKKFSEVALKKLRPSWRHVVSSFTKLKLKAED